MVTYHVIGQPTRWVDGAEKVMGHACYAADVALPGTIWGKSLHSTYAHARIVRIDTTAAKKVPGVHAVITGADVRGGLWGRAVKDVPVLAYDRVRFFGERVAAVAADDEDIAQRALDLIEVEYEELPTVFEPLEALKADAPILHPDFNAYVGFPQQMTQPSNAYHTTSFDKGDLERGFAEADLIIEHTYVTQRVHQGYIEPQAVLVNIDDHDRVHVWVCSKVPYNTRESLATVAAIPEEQILFHHVYIGGDFGGKGNARNTPICYFLAKVSGRPVRMVSDYTEELFAGNPRHSVAVQLKTGVRRDGTLTAHQVHYLVNSGAYAAFKPAGIIGGYNQAAGPYRIPNCRIESTFVYTNTLPCGFMRAPGEPQAVFALESHIDEVARRLSIDPLEFRLRNLIVDGEETASGERFEHVRVHETLRAAVEAAGYHHPKPPFVGRGIAIGDRPPGGGQATAAITLRPDGGVTLGTPIFDQGTGTYTTLCQVVAEELQMPLERIQLEIWNTDAIPFDSGVAGSRATRINTIVAHEAAQETKRELFRLTARALGWPEARLTLVGDEIRRTDQEGAMRWMELLARTGESVTGRAHIEERGRAHITSFAAQIAEVAVDPETGAVRVLRFTTAHDVGQIVHPIGHQGQIEGAIMQGVGYTLMEALQVEDGRVTNLSFGDYKLPTMRDAPPLTTVLVESATGVGPYQIKGIGESPLTPVAPAIANAVADAVGVRIRDLPLTAEKIYRVLTDNTQSWRLCWRTIDTSSNQPEATDRQAFHLMEHSARRPTGMQTASSKTIVHTGSHWGLYDAEVEHGRVVGVRAFAKDANPSPIIDTIPSAVHAKTRIERPMVRQGWLAHGIASNRAGRGVEPFVAVSWDEALDLVAAELKRVKAGYGNEAIYASSGWASAGVFHHAPAQLYRFLNGFGGFVRQVTNYSFGAASVIVPHVVGTMEPVGGAVTTWPTIAKHTRLMVVFGGIPPKNTQVNSGGIGRHEAGDWLTYVRQAGVAFVNISPLRDDAAEALGAEWLPLRPNTDVALMLGLAHTLIAEHLYDRAFLETYTVGFERLRAYVMGETDGRAKDANWAAQITQIPAQTIVALARRMAAVRTMIAVSWSVQRADHGEQPYWMAIALAAMLGQIGLPGGGFGFGYGATAGIGSPQPRFPMPQLPIGVNPVQAYIPVARFNDMLLNPAASFHFNGQRLTYPDIRLVYWCGGNPFHKIQDINRLLRAWQQPETIVIHEPWWTPAARRADIVLPCATTLERNDIGGATRDRFYFVMQKAIEPVGEAKTEYEIYSELADRLGFKAQFSEGRTEMEWLRHLYDRARQQAATRDIDLPSFDAFWEAGHVELPVPDDPPILFAAYRADPQAHPLRTPSGRIELFSDAIAAFGYDDCPGHPTWLEPAEWLGSERATVFPLHLISNQPRTRLHSQLDCGEVSRRGKVAEREPIWLHPDDAATRGIANGDVVRVYNDRGTCLAGAVVTQAIRPGVVQLATGAWFDPLHPGEIGSLDKHGNPNVLTLDKGSSKLAQCSVAQTVLVEVERFDGAPPPITVFFPPGIVQR